MQKCFAKSLTKCLPLLLFGCACLAACKSLVKQEPTSETEVAAAVAVFKKLMDNNYYWGARVFISQNIDNKAAYVKSVLRTYSQEEADSLQNLNNFLRSYTHAAAAIVTSRNIESLLGRIATSQRNQDVVALLAQAERHIDNINDLYTQRRRVQMIAAPQGSYSLRQLSDATHNDYKNWRGKVDKYMFDNVKKYLLRTTPEAEGEVDTWPVSIRDAVMRIRDRLEQFTP